MNKGTYVSRSTYQKVVEENKRLRADIRALVDGDITQVYEVMTRWHKHFQAQKQFTADLREILTLGREQSQKKTQ